MGKKNYLLMLEVFLSAVQLRGCNCILRLHSLKTSQNFSQYQNLCRNVIFLFHVEIRERDSCRNIIYYIKISIFYIEQRKLIQKKINKGDSLKS